MRVTMLRTSRATSNVLQKFYLNKTTKSIVNQAANHFHTSICFQPKVKKRYLKPWSKLSMCFSTTSIMDTSKQIYQKVGDETIVYSPFDDVHIPNLSFGEYVFSRLDDHKSDTCLVDNPTGRCYSASDIKELTIKVASGLTKMGFNKGDRIIIYTNNCPEYSILFLACGVTGIVLSTANPIYTASELARQMKHSESIAVVTSPNVVETVKSAINSDPELVSKVKTIITIGESEGCVPFSKLIEDDGKAFPENRDLDPKKEVLTLPYSSGTTGLPKGVELTHFNLVANLCQCVSGPMRMSQDEVLMGFLPFYHIYGMVVVQFAAICLGTKLVILPKFEPETFLSAIQRHKVSYMHIVPPTVVFLSKNPLVNNYDLSSVRTLVSAAAPLGRELTQEVKDRIKGVRVLQGYGLTETSPIVHYDNAPGKVGTIGQLIPNTEAKVVDVETGKSLPPHESGEILMRGPQVMKGYLKNEAATQGMVKDGWLHTGDLGHYDEEGYFTISDRLKELIKYKGYQIAPAELEAVLLSHPSVQDVAVVGVPSPEEGGHGEIPKAFIVAKPNTNPTENEITEFIKEHLAPYKWLRGGVAFVDTIQKTTSGKILRRQLKNK